MITGITLVITGITLAITGITILRPELALGPEPCRRYDNRYHACSSLRTRRRGARLAASREYSSFGDPTTAPPFCPAQFSIERPAPYQRFCRSLQMPALTYQATSFFFDLIPPLPSTSKTEA